MPTEKRQRQKEARIARLEAERKAARRAAARKRLITAVVIGVGVFAVLFLISVVGGDDDDEGTAADGTTTTVPTTTNSLAPRQDKPEVTVPDPLPTELVVEDLTVGEGEEAALGDTITVDYVGVTASDGNEFEASFDSEPATFDLVEGGLIEGWTQGLPGMRVGGRRQLVIPAELAYGDDAEATGSPAGTLIFVIDLLGVTHPTSADPPPPQETGAN